jgi:hypothetical protein
VRLLLDLSSSSHRSTERVLGETTSRVFLGHAFCLARWKPLITRFSTIPRSSTTFKSANSKNVPVSKVCACKLPAA